jgi:hypothetical protein
MLKQKWLVGRACGWFLLLCVFACRSNEKVTLSPLTDRYRIGSKWKAAHSKDSAVPIPKHPQPRVTTRTAGCDVTMDDHSQILPVAGMHHKATLYERDIPSHFALFKNLHLIVHFWRARIALLSWQVPQDAAL